MLQPALPVREELRYVGVAALRTQHHELPPVAVDVERLLQRRGPHAACEVAVEVPPAASVTDTCTSM